MPRFRGHVAACSGQGSASLLGWSPGSPVVLEPPFAAAGGPPGPPAGGDRPPPSPPTASGMTEYTDDVTRRLETVSVDGVEVYEYG